MPPRVTHSRRFRLSTGSPPFDGLVPARVFAVAWAAALRTGGLVPLLETPRHQPGQQTRLPSRTRTPDAAPGAQVDGRCRRIFYFNLSLFYVTPDEALCLRPCRDWAGAHQHHHNGDPCGAASLCPCPHTFHWHGFDGPRRRACEPWPQLPLPLPSAVYKSSDRHLE
jgi:hypothetical protein